MEDSWKRKWPRALAVLLVCMLVFQGDVLTALADSFHIAITLKDDATQGALNQGGINISLTGKEDSSVSGNGITDDNGVACITVSANEGDTFSVSVGDAGNYRPVEENPEITVSSGDNSFELWMKAPVQHTVSFEITGEGTVEDENHSVVTDQIFLNDDEAAEFTIEAAEHFHISSIVIDGNSVQEAWGNDSKNYTISLVGEKDHQVNVGFEKDFFALTVSSGDNGTVTVDRNDTLYFGDVCNIAITAGDDYNVERVLKNNEDITASLVRGEGNNNYAVSVQVEEDTVIEVRFVPIEKKDWSEISVSFNGADAYDMTSDDNSDYYFYQHDGIAEFTAVGDIRINHEKCQQNSRQITESTRINSVMVRDSLKWQAVQLDKNIVIVIDKDVPMVDPVSQPEWTKENTCQVRGTVQDADSGEFPASGIAYVVYSDDTELTAEKVAAGEGNRLDVTDTGEYEFSVSGEQMCTYNIWAVDKAGNMSQARSVLVRIDQTSPEITGFQLETINKTAFGSFNNDRVTVTVQASDEGSGPDKIMLYLDEEEYEARGVDENGRAKFVIPAAQVLDEKFCLIKRISAKAVDKVGNVTEQFVMPSEDNSNITNSTLMIETMRPAISITPNADVAYTDAQGRVFFADSTAFTIDIEDTMFGTEKNSGIRSVSISMNGNALEKDSNGKLIGRFYYMDQEKVFHDSFVIDMNLVPLPENGNYEIAVEVTDNAGNVNKKALTVFLDKTPPSIVNFDFQAERYLESSGENLSIVATDYGFYFREDTEIVIMARDAEISSGICSITYYTMDTNKEKSRENTVPVDVDGNIRIMLPAEFKGQIFARATDNAGNTANIDVTPDSAIVESPAQHDQEEHISLELSGSTSTDNNGNPLYSGDMTAKVKISDTWSGIRSVTWTIQAPYDESGNQSGEVTVSNDGILSGDGGWTIVKGESNLVLEMEKYITIQGNSNNIVLNVTMTDRAGNVSSQSKVVSIDKTAPSISISFDNETADTEYTDTYNADRVATVVIMERNFIAANVNCNVTNTDGWLPGVDLTNAAVWEESKNEENPDLNTYTARIPFTEDGDFTFGIAFTDKCGHAAASQEIQSFTIDKTPPQVSVTYDNNMTVNGNYYGEARTATIKVIEHNFDASRITIIGTHLDDGNEEAFPEESGWSSKGDEHSTTIRYDADGRYTFAIEGRDMAGNMLAEYSPEDFYVDLTPPLVKITGVEDKKPYNSTVAPVIEFTDTNIDRDSIEITLQGANNGRVYYSGNYEEITNGRRFVYDDFAWDKTTDDIYVLKVAVKDYAGHEAVEETEVTFSVNRFGSVYTFDSPDREEILGRYIKQERDIVFTETNVNELERDTILIKLMKNGVPENLQEGTDYTVSEKGGDGQWCQYTYTIKASLFAEDGTYIISVCSVDKAGNINENIDDKKYFDEENNIKAEIFFGVDKTAPVIIPIDLESNARYKEDNKQVTVDVKDNLILSDVQIRLNGSIVDYTVEDESYRFQIPESTESQTVEVLAYDAAGNANGVEIMNFMVTTSAFALWFHNTPLFVGTIVGALGAVGAGGGAVTAIVRRRKRKLVK